MALKKALLVSSHGGHWVQLLRIAPALEGMERHYVCTTSEVASHVAPERLSVVTDANLRNLPGLAILAFQTFLLVARCRPDLVLSTGAAPGYFALVFGKLFGARTVWVDSLANADRLSVSGARVRHFADLWLTQWPELARPEGPFYRGTVL